MGYDVVGEKGLLAVEKQDGFMDCGLECLVLTGPATGRDSWT